MTDQRSFKAKTARLKDTLGVSEDRAVAAALGFSAAAFSARKQRDSFPNDQLKKLASARPDLRIDVAYVLTGISASQAAAKRAPRGTPASGTGAGAGAEVAAGRLMASIVEAFADEAASLRSRRRGAYELLLKHCDMLEDGSVIRLLRIAMRAAQEDNDRRARRLAAALEAQRDPARRGSPVAVSGVAIEAAASELLAPMATVAEATLHRSKRRAGKQVNPAAT